MVFCECEKKSKNLRETVSKLRALTSLNQVEYDDLLRVFAPLIETKLRHYTLKGKRRKRVLYQEMAHSSLYGSQSKLDFILTYMKENPNQSYHGYLFEMSQSKVSEWVNFIIPSLEEALDRLCLLPQQGDYWDLEQESTDFLSMDVVERQVPRRSDYEAQKEEYSGKKNAIRLSIWRSLTQKARYYS